MEQDKIIHIGNNLRLKLDTNVRVGKVRTCTYIAQKRKRFLFIRWWSTIKINMKNLKTLREYDNN